MASGRHKTDPKGKKPPDQDANAVDANSLQEMINVLRDDICGKIDSLSTELRSEIATVRAELKSAIAPLQQKVDNHDSTIRELEHAASSQSDHLSELDITVQSLRTQVDQLNAKCEDLEGRSRRNNIRLIGIMEDVEGPNPTEFVSGLLQDILSLDQKPVLDRAHRSLREKPGKDKPPRPFIIRLHYYQDRDRILRKAEEASPLSYRESRVSIFPDYTTAVAKKRAQFGDAKRLLRPIKGVKFRLLFPALLKVTLPDGTLHKFGDPSAAVDFIKTITPANQPAATDS